ncbi:MAG: hypothetical protein ACYC4U_10300 [Pirellulaceae bacterium]
MTTDLYAQLETLNAEDSYRLEQGKRDLARRVAAGKVGDPHALQVELGTLGLTVSELRERVTRIHALAADREIAARRGELTKRRAKLEAAQSSSLTAFQAARAKYDAAFDAAKDESAALHREESLVSAAEQRIRETIDEHDRKPLAEIESQIATARQRRDLLMGRLGTMKTGVWYDEFGTERKTHAGERQGARGRLAAAEKEHKTSADAGHRALRVTEIETCKARLAQIDREEAADRSELSQLDKQIARLESERLKVEASLLG